MLNHVEWLMKQLLIDKTDKHKEDDEDNLSSLNGKKTYI